MPLLPFSFYGRLRPTLGMNRAPYGGSREERGGSFADPGARTFGRSRLRAGSVGVWRIVALQIGFFAAFVTIAARLAALGLTAPTEAAAFSRYPGVARPPVVDRNGGLLALDIPAVSIFAEPRRITDVDEVAERLVEVLPGLDFARLHARLNSKSAFAWIARNSSPEIQQRILDAGLPGIGFREARTRIYPQGELAAHVLGGVDVDNRGIAGIEHWIDRPNFTDRESEWLVEGSADGKPVQLSLDLRVQFAVEDELNKAIERFGAKAGAGLVLDVTNGEITALASLPSFDPGSPVLGHSDDRINRVHVGTYELGSIMKTVTVAMALESGRFELRSRIDASLPLRFGRFQIRDYLGQNRPLDIEEAFLHSSNIAMATMAMELGGDHQRQFLERLGLLKSLSIELPETGRPIVPRSWQPITTATVAFGHGLAITPLQAAAAVAALANGGTLIRPTLLRNEPVEPRILASNLISPPVGEALLQLLRRNVEMGTATRAGLPGYTIGGKTGTAEKVVDGRYSRTSVVTSFVGLVPAERPRYLLMVILDEPQGQPETNGFRTAGWNAAPAAGAIFRRILPVLDLMPSWAASDAEHDFPFFNISKPRASR